MSAHRMHSSRDVNFEFIAAKEEAEFAPALSLRSQVWLLKCVARRVGENLQNKLLCWPARKPQLAAAARMHPCQQLSP